MLVEGETEHLVYSALLQESEYKEKIHIVSCFGKGNIPLFAKILNHFGISYFAITEVRTCSDGFNVEVNPAMSVTSVHSLTLA